jgi:hypothetical protein
MTTFCARDQFHTGLVVVAAHEFGIGRVEHQKHVRSAGRHAGGAPRRTEYRCRSGCSGWRGRPSASLASPPPVWRRRRCDRPSPAQPRPGALHPDVDRVLQEAVLAHDGFVARGEIDAGQQRQRLVGAVEADDVLFVQPMQPRRSPCAATSPCRRDRAPSAPQLPAPPRPPWATARTGFRSTTACRPFPRPDAPRSCPAHRRRCPSRRVWAGADCCWSFAGCLSKACAVAKLGARSKGGFPEPSLRGWPDRDPA